jgi:hypothetical protein
VSAWRRTPGTQIVLLFYFSGHSDGHALELGRDRVSFADLRDRLHAIDADLRVVVVDSCRSGNILAVKGGTLGPAYDIALADNLASSGEVLITSSAADEAALESSEIGGSFFSHHFVSGLRGAADASGDGLVTLAEAYQYAFARTVTSTADTVVGTQHPGYDYRLSGRGDLVLTQVLRPSAILDVPSGFDRVLVVDQQASRVLAELGPGGARRLALRPGVYLLHGRRGNERYSGRVTLAAGANTRVSAGDLAVVSARDQDWFKGGGGEPVRRSAIALGAGVSQATTEGFGVMPALRLGLARGTRWTLFAGAQLASARRDDVRETHGQLIGAAFARVGGSRFELLVGPELAAGLAWQAVGQGAPGGARTNASFLVDAGPVARVAVRIGSTSWGLTVRSGAAVLERDGRATVRWSSAAVIDAWWSFE